MNSFDLPYSFAVVVGGFFGYFYGGWTIALTALCYFVVVDYVSGVFAAANKGELNPQAAYKGITKKLMIFLAVGVAHILDGLLQTNFIMSGTIFGYSYMELISIAKNADSLGMPLPAVILNAIERTKPGGLPNGQ